jgi:Domain of unknown function (DUF397)
MDTIDRVQWRKSSYSGSNGGACVEVAHLPGGVLAVRDSKDPGGPKLAFAADEWAAFTEGVKAGEFDLT